MRILAEMQPNESGRSDHVIDPFAQTRLEETFQVAHSGNVRRSETGFEVAPVECAQRLHSDPISLLPRVPIQQRVDARPQLRTNVHLHVDRCTIICTRYVSEEGNVTGTGKDIF